MSGALVRTSVCSLFAQYDAACQPGRPPCQQDVVEIMRQTLDGQVASGGGDLGLLDFTAAPAGGRAGTQAAERRRLLEALARRCQVRCNAGARASQPTALWAAGRRSACAS